MRVKITCSLQTIFTRKRVTGLALELTPAVGRWHRIARRVRLRVGVEEHLEWARAIWKVRQNILEHSGRFDRFSFATTMVRIERPETDELETEWSTFSKQAWGTRCPRHQG